MAFDRLGTMILIPPPAFKYASAVTQQLLQFVGIKVFDHVGGVDGIDRTAGEGQAAANVQPNVGLLHSYSPPTPKKFAIGDTITSPGQVIPLTHVPNQTVNVSLNIDDDVIDLTLLLRYFEIPGYWVMTLEDSSGNLLLDSIPLVSGNNPADNLLQQFSYLKISSVFVINASIETQDYPGMATLGNDLVLIWSGNPQIGVFNQEAKLLALATNPGLAVLIDSL
jgi:hypothetical protein